MPSHLNDKVYREVCLGISIIDRFFIFCINLLVSRRVEFATMYFINSITFFFIRCRIEILHQSSLYMEN